MGTMAHPTERSLRRSGTCGYHPCVAESPSCRLGRDDLLRMPGNRSGARCSSLPDLPMPGLWRIVAATTPVVDGPNQTRAHQFSVSEVRRRVEDKLVDARNGLRTCFEMEKLR